MSLLNFFAVGGWVGELFAHILEPPIAGPIMSFQHYVLHFQSPRHGIFLVFYVLGVDNNLFSI